MRERDRGRNWLSEAEAIGAGVPGYPYKTKREHVIALLTELQRVRVQLEHSDVRFKAQGEALARQVEREAVREAVEDHRV